MSGGLKRLMWYGIVKESNCKATSMWSKCGREGEREDAFTHRQHGDRRQEWKAQPDHIIGPKWKSDEACIYNDVKLWDSWDHHPIYVRIQEDEIAKHFPARKREISGQDGGQRQMCKKLNSSKKIWRIEMRSLRKFGYNTKKYRGCRW